MGVGRKLLVIGDKSNFVGGLERYVYESSLVLKELGYELHGVFANNGNIPHGKKTPHGKKNAFVAPFVSVCWGYREEYLETFFSSGIKTVLIHSCDAYGFVEKILQRFKTIFFVHDHSYYCRRGQKYFPVANGNCKLASRKIYCVPCAWLSRGKNQKIEILPLLRKCDTAVVLSNYMKKNLILNRVKKEKIVVLPPVVELRSFPACDEMTTFSHKKSLDLCFVGQLVHGKGIDLLFKSLKKILKNNYQINLHIVGEGYQRRKLELLAKRMHLLKNIVFYGKQENPAATIAASDIVVVPSRWQEPFGLVGVEAMLQSKPVVAFQNGGIEEWLEDGVTGLFSKSGSIKNLQEKIIRLLESKSLREKMGQLGRQAAKEKFNKQKFKQRIFEIVSRVETI